MKHLKNAVLIGLISLALFEASLHLLSLFVSDPAIPQTPPTSWRPCWG